MRPRLEFQEKFLCLMSLGPLVLWVFFSLRFLGYGSTLKSLQWLRQRGIFIAPPKMPLAVGLRRCHQLCVRYFHIQQCLVHALAGHHYCSTVHPELQLCLGVVHQTSPQPQFHAWLEHEGVVVLGQREANLIPFHGWKNS